MVVKLLKRGTGVHNEVAAVTTISSPGSDDNFPSEQAVREAIDAVPSAHKATHENGGADEISVAGLSGVLADAQTPASHNQAASTINSGTLDGDRLPAADTSKKGAVPVLDNNVAHFLNGRGGWTTPAGGSAILPFKTVGFTAGMDYVCDGTADDVQINQAIVALNAIGGGIIWLGPGTYNLAATIDITNRPNIYIYGSRNSIIDATAVTIGILIDYNVGSGYASEGCFELKGFVLRRTTTNANSVGIKILTTGNGEFSVIDHLWVYGFNTCIGFLGPGPWPTYSATGQCAITNCEIGKWSDSNRTSYGLYMTRVIQVNIWNNNFSSFTQAGIYGERIDSSVIKDNIIISGNNFFGGSNPQYGIRLSPTASDQLIVDVEISGNAIENTFVQAILISGTQSLFQVFIHDNEINGYNTGILVDGSSTSCYSIHIYNNDIHNWREGNGRPIWVLNAYDVTIDHNTIDATGTEFGEGIRFSAGGRGGGSIIGNIIHRGATTQIGGIVVGGSKVAVIGNAFTGTGTLTKAIDLTSTSSYCSAIGNVGTQGAITNSGSNNVVPAGTNT